ncbi:MAG: SDR family NAD(P)-dependent oxidoreductase [Spirochaetota bacterium]
MSVEKNTLVEILKERAKETPDATIYTYLEDGEIPSQKLTYFELDRDARKIANYLQNRGWQGKTVLVIFPAGLDFFRTFYGCLYAGVIAVPLPAPDPMRLNRTMPRLQAVANDSNAPAALVSAELLSGAKNIGLDARKKENVSWISIGEALEGDEKLYHSPDLTGDSIAYIQYTSGSTNIPKGVIITHANILVQSRILQKAHQVDADSVYVFWLPHYHDYGLVEGYIQPLYSGIPCYILSPMDFLQKPVRWLKALSDYRGTHTAAPPFAAELCVKRTKPEEILGMDLSCVKNFGIGAEPIYVETINRFYNVFRNAGLPMEAISPGYGLAEATLAVASCHIGKPEVCIVDRAFIESKNQVVEVASDSPRGRAIVSCGRVVEETDVIIVDPESLEEVKDDLVGEIWVAADCVSPGYWNLKEETERTFQARLKNEDRGPFLRTGDLGFFHKENLYITGRLKDLLIIRGQNHYPTDIESTVFSSNPDLRAGCGIAFAITEGNEERLVIVQEVYTKANTPIPELLSIIQQAVAEEHELDIHTVVLIKEKTIPKTSSGKIQRSLCRKLFQEGKLEQINAEEETLKSLSDQDFVTETSKDTKGLRKLLMDLLANHLGTSPESLNLFRPFVQLGLNSAKAASLSGELSEIIERKLPPTIFYEYPNIESLLQFLMQDSPKSLEKLVEKSQTPFHKTMQEGIAIVGIGCRFPGGVETPETFWEFLSNGKNGIKSIPPARLDLFDLPKGVPKDFINKGGYLDDIQLFDANFFNIAPKEAERMDPQQRILMETAWCAFEDAGIASETLHGHSVGVFMGVSTNDYGKQMLRDREDSYDHLNPHMGTGSALSIAANRLSYFFGFRGPSLTIDTACSSSLVAVRLACQSLLSGESEIALAGGVNLILSPELNLIFNRAGMLSPKGQCQTFSASADGYVRSEGAGVVILKPLSKAIANGDYIYAVIRGGAINNDGQSNGLMAPNPKAQKEVLQQAYKNAGVEPAHIDYVECHGTGTLLGDPIEAHALGETLYSGRKDECLIGSVKSNIGHLESAAGIAGLIKTALSLKQGQIPASLHFSKPNPHIPFASLGLQVPTQTLTWPNKQDKPRLAGVSSFGFGGTNCHLVLQAAPGNLQPFPVRERRIWNKKAFWHANIKKPIQQSIPNLAFIFSGQGPQWFAMGRELAEKEPIFQEKLQECDRIMQEFAPWSLLDELSVNEKDSRMNRTKFAQPALFALQTALVSLWQSQGIRPSAVLGHSVGEIAAAHCAGILSLEMAVKLAVERGRIMDRAHGKGKMASVDLGIEDAQELVKKYDRQLAIAAYNAPDSVVVSGNSTALQDFIEQARKQKLFVRELMVDFPFHSPIMETFRGELIQALGDFPTNEPRCSFYSSITGKQTQTGFQADFWETGIHGMVHFYPALQRMLLQGCDTFIEIGPHPVLADSIQRTLTEQNREALVLPSLLRKKPEQKRFNESLRQLQSRYREELGGKEDTENAAPFARDVYRVSWKPIPLPEYREKDGRMVGEKWLFFTSKSSQGLQWGQEVADMLEAKGGKATFTDTSNTLISGDFEKIVFLGFAEKTIPDENQLELCKNLLKCIQAIQKGELTVKSLHLVTANAQQVSEEVPNPTGSILWGMGRSIALELADIRTYLYDLTNQQVQAETAQILFQLLCHSNNENQFALRKEKLYCPRLVETKGIDFPSKHKLRLSPNSSYLVIGGLGGLGNQLARRLAQRGAGELILTGRSASPDEEALRRITNTSSSKTQVRYLQTDVSDPQAVANLMQNIKKNSLPLKGIFHLAGISQQKKIEELTSEDLQSVFAPKIQGAWNLHQETEKMQLDYFVLFSSISAVRGASYLAHYAAANSYLNSLSAYRRGAGLAALSISWGPWSGPGMASDQELQEFAKVGLLGLSPQQGLDQLEILLQSEEHLPVVARLDLDTFQRITDTAAGGRFLENLGNPTNLKPAENKALVQLLASLPPGEAQESLLQHLREVTARVLGHQNAEEVKSTTGFFQMGMDSVLALELVNLLGKDLGKKLPRTLLFEQPNPQALSQFLLQEIRPQSKSNVSQVNRRSFSKSHEDAVAILGMGCRLPGGVRTPESFWDLLMAGKVAISEIPSERWDTEFYYHPDSNKAGKMNTRYGGFLDGIDMFDADFFQISPREARTLDPQQRLLLETAWEAMENAGVQPDTLRGSRTGVFVGLTLNDYFRMQSQPGWESNIDMYSSTGGGLNAAAGRISYFLGLEGPSIAVDAACASSLVSLHLAVQALRRGECDYALAGGVNLILLPDSYLALSQAGLLAPDGLCKTFDARANGIGRSEGCGMVLLKRQSDALVDKDGILALIRGSALGQDGASTGLTAPNGQAQQALIREALRDASLQPSDITYVEAHGTGTSLGDPVEVRALQAVLGEGRDTKNPLFLGSAKTNLGHTESAAGITGVIKTVLSLQNKAVPPHPTLQELNPELPLHELPALIPTEAVDWNTADSKKRIAGVSSFGVSGSLAHVIIEEAPSAITSKKSKSSEAMLLPLSAHNNDALRQRAKLLANYAGDLENLCYTISRKQTHHNQRLAVAFSSREELQASLRKYSLEEISIQERPPGGLIKNAFLYSGLGGQWPQMGIRLYRDSSVFKNTLLRCDEIISPLLGYSLIKELLQENQKKQSDKFHLVQLLIFSIQAGLSDLWNFLGILPDAIVGHSMGEVAAAYASGALQLEDAAQVIYHRSRLLNNLQGKGALGMVNLPPDAVVKEIAPFKDHLALAAINSSNNVVISGDLNTLEMSLHRLEEKGVYCRLIKNSVAGHSPQVEELVEELYENLHGIQPRKENFSLYSTVTGDLIQGNQLNADYWIQNLRKPVQFYTAIQKLEKKERVFIEVGPHPVLAHSIRQDSESLVLPSMLRDKDEYRTFLNSLGVLYSKGYPVQWQSLFPGGERVDLPPYPWQRKRYWLSETTPTYITPLTSTETLTGKVFTPAGGGSKFWEKEITLKDFPWVNHHRVQDSVLMPGPAYIESVITAATNIFGEITPENPIFLENVNFHKPLFLSKDDTVTYQIQISQVEGTDHGYTFQVYTHNLETWNLHCSGNVRRGSPYQEKPIPPNELAAGMSDSLSSQEFYQELSRVGVGYGTKFQSAQDILLHNDGALREVTPVELEFAGYHIHPALLDVTFQTVLALDSSPNFYLPSAFVFQSIRLVEVYNSLPVDSKLWSYANRLPEGENRVSLLDVKGKKILKGEGLQLKYLNEEDFFPENLQDWLLQEVWEKKEYSPGKNPGTVASDWLILSDDVELTRTLQDRLPGSCVVTSAASFTKQNASLYCLNPEDPKHWDDLLQDWNPKGTPGVIHIWNLDLATYSPEKLEEAVTRGTGSLILFLHALHKNSRKAKLWCVTPGANALSSEENSLPIHGTIKGLYKALSEEWPEVYGGLLELAPSATSPSIVETIAQEINAGEEEPHVAFLKGERYVPRLKKVRNLQKRQHPLDLKGEGTVLITGGLGDLGLLAAERMVSQGARSLLLIGRSKFPETGSLVAKRIEALRRTPNLRLEYVSVDVGDYSALSVLLQNWQKKYASPIRGLIHTAGAGNLCSFSELNLQKMQEGFRAKVLGTWNLHRLLQEKDLDFFVVYSSATSFLASPLLSIYSAANSFMDSLALYRRNMGLPALSINWGYWSETGVAKRTYVHKSEREFAKGMGPISSLSGMDALELLLASDAVQVGVLPAQWNLWAKFHPGSTSSPYFEHLVDLPQEGKGKVYKSLQLELTEAGTVQERQEHLESYLKACIQRALEIGEKDIPENTTINKLGFDSLMAVELKRNIQNILDIEIPMVLFLKDFTVQKLALSILELLGDIDPTYEPVPVASDQKDTPICYSFPSVDGLEIYGHLSLPEGKEPFPVVVVHTAFQGGALNTKGEYEFIKEHTPLTNAGFAVLTVDQRGAPGHGTRYLQYNDIGGKDVDDLISAAGFISKLPEIAEENIFFMGSSRGAFAGLLALQRSPELWRGAVLNMGFYDAIAQFEQEERGTSQQSGLAFIMGSPLQELKEYFSVPERSPLLGIDKVRCPVLILHGNKDDMVDCAQAKILAKVMEKNSVVAQLEIVEGMGHDIGFENHQWPQIWKQLTNFFQRNLK